MHGTTNIKNSRHVVGREYTVTIIIAVLNLHKILLKPWEKWYEVHKVNA